jgi:hypothetical protein
MSARLRFTAHKCSPLAKTRRPLSPAVRSRRTTAELLVRRALLSGRTQDQQAGGVRVELLAERLGTSARECSRHFFAGPTRSQEVWSWCRRRARRPSNGRTPAAIMRQGGCATRSTCSAAAANAPGTHRSGCWEPRASVYRRAPLDAVSAARSESPERGRDRSAVKAHRAPVRPPTVRMSRRQKIAAADLAASERSWPGSTPR